jgi:hypothetical protein
MRFASPALGIVVFVSGGLAGAAPVAAAPQQLLNKTVTLAWTAQSVLRGPDGKVIQVNPSIKYVIYISSQGRLFERSSRSLGGRTQRGDHLDATQTGIGEARGLRFEGNTLVAYRDFAGGGGSGAMRAVVTFDSSYSSCSVTVRVGKESGKVMKRQGLDGVVREILSTTTTGTSCSIQNGNAFAN